MEQAINGKDEMSQYIVTSSMRPLKKQKLPDEKAIK